MNKLLTMTAATCAVTLGGLASLASGCGEIQIPPSQLCTPGELMNCFCDDNNTGKALCGPKGAPGTCKCTTGADGGADASGGDVAVTGCEPGTECDDGDPCTDSDLCRADRTCQGTAKSCDDGRACTVDACDASTGQCLHNPSSCGCQSDGDCDDNTPCTTDLCDPDAGSCIHTPIPGCGAECMTDADCDDGDPCTYGWCDTAIEQCVFDPAPCGCTTDPECADGDPCTEDFCDTGAGTCIHAPIPGCGMACGTDVDCSDGDTCTADICMSGVCEYVPQGSHYHFEGNPGGGFDSPPELSSFLDPNVGFTIEMWVQLMPQLDATSMPDGSMTILDAMNGPFGGSPSEEGFAILAAVTPDSPTGAEVVWWQGGTQTSATVAAPPLGTWFHLAVACTDTSELLVWVDGQEVVTGDPQWCNPSPAAIPWSWAGSPDEAPLLPSGSSVWLDGLVLLDNVQVSMGMHHAPGADFEPPLGAAPDDSTVAVYGFEEGDVDGVHVFDGGPYGLDGEIFGGSFDQPGYPPCP